MTILLLSSCAFHSGMMTSNLPGSSETEIIGTAKGEAKMTHVLFFGGLERNAIVAEAKRNLYHNYRLKKGEFFGNVSVDFKFVPLLLFNITTVTVTADVFAENVKDELHPIYGRNLEENLSTISPLKGDSVIVFYQLKPLKGRVVDVNAYGKCEVQIFDQTISVDADHIYYFDPELNPGPENIKVNTQVMVYDPAKDDREARVLGLNKKYSLVDYGKKIRRVETYRLYTKKE